MRNQILTTHGNKYSEELYFTPIRWYESGCSILTVEKSSSSRKELKKLYQEAQEYDFLNGKTPGALPDSWEEEE